MTPRVSGNALALPTS